MQIIFEIDRFHPSQMDHARTTRLIANKAAAIGCPLEAISNVVVASPNRAAAAVRKIAKTSVLTNNEHYQAIGKTIALPPENGVIKSAIVIVPGILNMALRGQQGGIAHLSVEEQLLAYVLTHELGHALDNYSRRQDDKIHSVVATDGFFRIEHIANYYTDIVVSEAAACRNAAMDFSEALFGSELANTRDTFSDMLTQLKTSTSSYSGDPVQLEHIAYTSAGCFWTLLIQYSKLVGHQMGNKSLSIGGRAVLGSSADVLLAECDTLIHTCFSTYPKIHAELSKGLTSIWRRVANAYGFKYSEATSPIAADSVEWDRLAAAP